MTPEGATLYKMIKRCTDPKDPSFKDYGGRGVKVCADWMFGRDGKSKYQTFIKDMGHRPTPQHTIDRIDNDGNYEPANCQWSTRLEQAKNKRNNVRLTCDGQTLILADWARLSGIPAWTIQRRLKNGVPLEAIVRPCE
jgi:hypothetical protein